MAEFAEHVEVDDGLRLRSYDDVLDWSLQQPGDFWNELAKW
jgi:hypothetical protein